MVKSAKVIISIMVVCVMAIAMLNSCGQNNPAGSPHAPGTISPGMPNAYTSGPKPVILPAWINNLPPASIACLLKQPNLNLNAKSPNNKPFDKLCGPYTDETYTVYFPDKSTGILINHIWPYTTYSDCPFGPPTNSPDYKNTCGGWIAYSSPTYKKWIVPCGDPCMIGGNFPDDAFAGNGAPSAPLLGPDGTIYDNMGSPPLPPASGPPKLIWVGITPDIASISVGQTASFTATGIYNPPPVEKDITASIKSLNPAVATVTNGVVTGISEGHAELSVSLDGVWAWSYVDVVLGSPDRVVIEPASASILIGDTYSFRVFAEYPGNKRIDVTTRYETTWSIDTTVATISNGAITGVASGSTPVSATFKGVTGTATLDVIEIPPLPDTVQITPLNASIAQGETQQFIATAIYPNRSIDITTDVNTTWTAGDTSKATIDSSGLARGLAPGQSFIWCNYKNVQSSSAAMLNVSLPKLRLSLIYTPINPKVGDYVILTAYLDSSDINVPTVDVTASWKNTTYTTDNPPMIHNITGIFNPPQITSNFWIDTDGTANIYATHQTTDGRIASGSIKITVGQKKTNACGIVYPRLYQYTGWDVNPPTDSAWARYPYANYTSIGPGSTFWGDMEMFDGSVGYLGCNLTCYSMILSTIDPTLTPGKLNRVLKEKGWYDGGNGPMPIALRKLSNEQIKQAYNTTYDNATWKAELDKCNVIIAHRAGSQPSGHYVLVIGYNNQGEFMAYDPARNDIQYLTDNLLIMDSGHIMVKFN